MTRLALLVGMLLALGVAPAEAQTLDQEQPQSTQGGLVISSSQSVAQSFSAGLSGTLDRVDLFLMRGTAGSDLTVEIRSVAGGLPTNTVLASTTIAGASVPPPLGAFVTATFAAPAAVVAGTEYAIVAYTAGGTYSWVMGPGDVYAGGRPFVSSGSPPGTFRTALSSADLAFRTFVTQAPYGISPSVERLALSGSTLSFRLVSPATVRIAIDRRLSRTRYRRVGSFRVRAKRGLNRVRLPRWLSPKRLRKGTYRLSARAVGAGGLTGPPARRTIRVR